MKLIHQRKTSTVTLHGLFHNFVLLQKIVCKYSTNLMYFVHASKKNVHKSIILATIGANWRYPDIQALCHCRDLHGVILVTFSLW